jgi:S-adenosylmethionine:tRNA ribosyltransferase-isomerase
VKSHPVRLEDYDYSLPDDRIARFPLRERDQSNLLLYANRKIRHRKFNEIAKFLPEKSLLVFNETRVIPARLEFSKPTGAKIEIFLLDPIHPSPDAVITMKSHHEVVWHCLIKNLKKWNRHVPLEKSLVAGSVKIILKAVIDDLGKSLISLSWEPAEFTFAEVLENFGKVPLPPYLKREPVSEDRKRYQTVYSRNDGAVAAPTAGLHFTSKILHQLEDKGFQVDYLTLHVSAGTFQPIRHPDITQHPMHSEQISFTRANIRNLLQSTGPVIAIGTTSLRTLESLYWYGVKLLKGTDQKLFIDALYPYQIGPEKLPSKAEALQAVLDLMENYGKDKLSGETGIFIFPGYRFKICEGLVTNFHMPRSTLLLLVAAWVGDQWKNIYQEALDHRYRFLSYGDASLLLP